MDGIYEQRCFFFKKKWNQKSHFLIKIRKRIEVSETHDGKRAPREFDVFKARLRKHLVTYV